MATASRERHFVVAASGPFELTSILDTLAPGDANALREGRVFIDGQRANAGALSVAVGSRVTWVAARTANTTSDLGFAILDRYEDLLVVEKPAAWISEPDRTGRTTSLRERVAEELGVLRVHIVTRLDAGVSGLVLVAVGNAACQYASKIQQQGQLRKHYLALAVGEVDEDAEWNQPVDGTKACSLCHPLGVSNLVRFSTQLQCPVSLLRVSAITGRHHQIRVHSAKNNHPLLGDRRYGGPSRFTMLNGTVRTLARPLLHAWKLEVHLPGRIWTTFCNAPADMRTLWADLGGPECWPECANSAAISQPSAVIEH